MVEVVASEPMTALYEMVIRRVVMKMLISIFLAYILALDDLWMM